MLYRLAKKVSKVFKGAMPPHYYPLYLQEAGKVGIRCCHEVSGTDMSD
jgi:hypothetical protein